MQNKQASSAHVTNYAADSSSGQSSQQSHQGRHSHQGNQGSQEQNYRNYNNIKKVAITGTLAAGKSASLHILQNLGYPVLSCDSVVHDILENNAEVKNSIKHHFPEAFKNGEFSRALLAKIVFANKAKLSMLEDFIYPHLNRAIDKFFSKCAKEHNSENTVSQNGNTATNVGNASNIYKNIVFVEIPLLFEKETHTKLFDSVICIDAKTDIRTERFISRPNKTVDDFDRVEMNQMNPITKRGLSDYCIENSGTMADLKRAILIVISRLQQLK